jgi:PAS domain S-box-containing protein
LGTFYSFNVEFPPHKVTIMWTLFLPMLAALSFGWRSGLIAATAGLAGFFPFWQWPSNGWANLVNVLQYTGWYVWHGYCAEQHHKRPSLWNNLYIAQVIFTLCYAVLQMGPYYWLFQLNPPFWYPSAATSMPFMINVGITVKAVFSLFMQMFLCDALMTLPAIRRFFALPVSPSARFNLRIIVTSFLISLMVVISYFALEAFLFKGSITEISHYILAPQFQRIAVLILLLSLPAGAYLAGFFERRLEAEDELRKDKEKYRELVENANSIILKMDPSGKVTFFNEFAQGFFKYTEEEIVGRNVVGTIVPERESTGRDLKRMIEEIGLNPDGYVSNINENIRRDGERVWVAWTNKPIRDVHGRVVGILCIGNDITERKRAEEELCKSEERLKLALEAAQDAVWDWHVKSGGSYYSPRFYTMLGYEPREFEMNYKVLRRLAHPNDIGAVESILTDVLQGRADSYSIEFRMRAKDGSYRWLLGRGKAVEFAEDGSVLRLAGTNSDITERRRLEEQLRQVQKMEALGTLASGIAHDFNNILAGIIGFAELLSMFHLPDEEGRARNHVDQILNAGYRARDLVQQVLTLSREREQEKMPVQLHSLIKEVGRFLRSSLPTTIEIRRIINCQDATVLADPTQMHQVLMNLCTNAAHAMKDGGGVLEIRLDEVELDAQNMEGLLDLPPGPYLMMAVSDTGHGMSEQIMEKVFDPYFTTKKPAEGTGLGLAVVQGIVKNHGGTIAVRSEDGKGTTFQVFLPRCAEGTVASVAESEGLPPKGSECILFVDDEESIVNLSKQALVNLGYDVVGETSSTQALETFIGRPDRFDLVVTDLTMPHMTGLRLAREIHRVRADVPIILCSGFSRNVPPEEGRMKEIRHFLTKPVTIRHLAEAVRKVLDQNI